jgi:chromate transporter
MPEETPSEGPEAVSFLQTFSYWPKLGFISSGGPAGQISIMQ